MIYARRRRREKNVNFKLQLMEPHFREVRTFNPFICMNRLRKHTLYRTKWKLKTFLVLGNESKRLKLKYKLRF